MKKITRVLQTLLESRGFSSNYGPVAYAPWTGTYSHPQKSCFEVVRIRGSHHSMRHPGGRYTVIPVHSGETIGPGLLIKILKDAELDRSDLKK